MNDLLCFVCVFVCVCVCATPESVSSECMAAELEALFRRQREKGRSVPAQQAQGWRGVRAVLHFCGVVCVCRLSQASHAGSTSAAAASWLGFGRL